MTTVTTDDGVEQAEDQAGTRGPDAAHAPDVPIEAGRASAPKVVPADFCVRATASLIDTAILFVVFIVFALLWGDSNSTGGQANLYLTNGPLVLYLLVVFAYYALTEALLSASPGKLTLGIRVFREDGSRVSWGQSAIRNLVRFIDWLPLFYFVGIVVMAAGSDKRRLGDRAAGTVVANRRAEGTAQACL